MSLASRLAALAVKRTAKAAEEGAARRAAPLAVKRAEEAAAPLAVRRAAPRALPAPPKRLALPAPGPGLPAHAAKPRGGQFWADKRIDGYNSSPENAARIAAAELNRKHEIDNLHFTPVEAGELTMDAPEPVGPHPASEWLQKALAKYYKTDFGSLDDPLRDLAARGLHYNPEMTPERWRETANELLLEDPLHSILLPYNAKGGMPGAGDDLRAAALTSMPWLAKQPVTDKLYGISGGGLDLGHFIDEFHNAMNPAESGIPADLAVRPEMLSRMSFPQAVERVGRINQFRAKQMEEAALNNLSSPAIHTFKEYPENNPMGLRWVELKHPGYTAPEGWNVVPADDAPGYHYAVDETGRRRGGGVTPDGALAAALVGTEHDLVSALQEALKYEGDTMGHCVGGYCDDVASGRSRIFSLRDAKGEPHVTIETAPGGPKGLSQEQMNAFQLQAEAQVSGADFADDDAYFEGVRQLRDQLKQDWIAAQKASAPENIVQIKGKQNRAPKDDYLPFVQDFVKSGTWGDVGDLRNTGLTKLPDGRYIRQDQWQEGAAKMLREANPTWEDDWLQQQLQRNYPSVEQNPHTVAERWNDIAKHFEGYAVGGRVSADRCFTRSPFAVGRR